MVQWVSVKPVYIKHPFDELFCSEYADVLFIQVKLTKISYIGTWLKFVFIQVSVLFRVQFRQVSVLFRVQFRQVSVLFRFLFYSGFSLSRFLFYSGFSLSRFLFYSGFSLSRFLFYSGFSLDRFHCIIYVYQRKVVIFQYFTGNEAFPTM
jgi:hypothetical protein